MIVPVLAFAALLAGINADIDFGCVSPIASYTSCAAHLSGNCAENQTLFDVMDPHVLCNAKVSEDSDVLCKDGLSQGCKQADQMGCCTLNSLYPAMELYGEGDGNCSTSEPLSYEGFSQVLDYFCAAEELAGEDFYCITDGKEVLMHVAGLMEYTYISNMTEPERIAYLGANVNCATIQATQCCYPSIKEFIQGCGDDAAQELLGPLDGFLENMPLLCAGTQSIELNLVTKCAGLTDIDNCFAATDPNCNNDDDAAATLMPTFASVFAAIIGFLFFARQL